jgi:hypothetical protein
VKAQPENEFLENIVLKLKQMHRKAFRYSEFAEVVLENHSLLSSAYKDAVCKHVLDKLAAKNELVYVPGGSDESEASATDDR